MLAMPHMRQASTEQITKDRHGRTEMSITYEGMASPRELLERINIQCSSFIAGMTAMERREVESGAAEPTPTVSSEEGGPAGHTTTSAFVEPVTPPAEEEDEPETKRMLTYWWVAQLHFTCHMAALSIRATSSSHSTTVMEAVRSVDRALLDTKGPQFMTRLRDSLPRVQTEGANTARALVGATEEETRKNCRYRNLADPLII
jgi:hypothetical protein